MECGCSIDVYDDEYVYSEYSEKTATCRCDIACDECLRVIPAGEEHKRAVGKIPGERHVHRTCSDCDSVANTFFCGRRHGSMWEKFLDDLEEAGTENFSYALLAKLTPRAREMACEEIERVWADEEDEEE